MRRKFVKAADAAALTRPCEDGERFEGGFQFGAVVLLGEGAEDDHDDGVDDALLAQERRGGVVSRRGLYDLQESRGPACGQSHSIAARSLPCAS